MFFFFLLSHTHTHTHTFLFILFFFFIHSTCNVCNMHMMIETTNLLSDSKKKGIPFVVKEQYIEIIVDMNSFWNFISVLRFLFAWLTYLCVQICIHRYMYTLVKDLKMQVVFVNRPIIMRIMCIYNMCVCVCVCI